MEGEGAGEQSPQGIMALTYMLHCFQDFDFVHHSTTNLRLGEREREREWEIVS